MNFASDNMAGIAPAILAAIVRANEGAAVGYGSDALSRAVERRIAELFEHEAAVFLVETGTAANALALAQLAPPWGGVLCHNEAHIAVDECGAPEFFGGGLKLIGLPGAGGKLSASTVAAAIARYRSDRPHSVDLAALSLTQATEPGTIYQIDELRALCDAAHAKGLAVHMDGARFANALVSLGVTPAEMTWKAGIDVVSFGATKNGAMAAEAIVIFDPARAEAMHRRRKRAGHLMSKHRFLAAQFDGYLADDYWLTLARHANAMAARLAAGFAARGLAPVWPVEANLVFVILPPEIDARLRAAGASYLARPADGLPSALKPGEVLARFVTSFATEEEEIEALMGVLGKG